MAADRDSLSDQTEREGFGPDACDQDRVDAPTRDRLQRLYGSVDLLADRSRATADGQYEDVKALEVIIGDLRAENQRLRQSMTWVESIASNNGIGALFLTSREPAMPDRLCAKCGAPVYASEADQPARLCAVHLQEAIANTPPFADGKDAGSTPGCRCDGPCPECPSGKPRKSCPICDGYGALCCEMPCWQRVGLTSEPCCAGCPPLPDPEPEPVTSVTALPSREQGLTK